MELRRLAWAGLEIKAGGVTAVIDYVEDFAGLHGSDEPPPEEIPTPPGVDSVDLALLTHMHRDHADIAALEHVLNRGAPVLRPVPATGSGRETAFVEGTEAVLAESGLVTKILDPWETLEVDPFEISALPAVDLAPRQPPSPLPAGMGPKQAAAAAKLLGADLVVPIHYGPLHETPAYVQADDPAGSLEAAARELGVSARALEPGESLSL